MEPAVRALGSSPNEHERPAGRSTVHPVQHRLRQHMNYRYFSQLYYSAAGDGFQREKPTLVENPTRCLSLFMKSLNGSETFLINVDVRRREYLTAVHGFKISSTSQTRFIPLFLFTVTCALDECYDVDKPPDSEILEHHPHNAVG